MFALLDGQAHPAVTCLAARASTPSQFLSTGRGRIVVNCQTDRSSFERLCQQAGERPFHVLVIPHHRWRPTIRGAATLIRARSNRSGFRRPEKYVFCIYTNVHEGGFRCRFISAGALGENACALFGSISRCVACRVSLLEARPRRFGGLLLVSRCQRRLEDTVPLFEFVTIGTFQLFRPGSQPSGMGSKYRPS